MTVSLRDLDALIFDLDGVLTDTAAQHFRAWKRMFDEYMHEKGMEQPVEPFTEQDYLRYVDGKPRLDGAESFLASRGISLPRGTPDDPPGAETVWGLGTLKNRYYHEILEREKVGPFPDAVELLRRARAAGLRTAMVSSSRNATDVLEAAGLMDFFGACVDGHELERLHLEGKPAPDIFLEAARRLGVDAGRAAMFEDARSGVEAGRRGHFRHVVGVARDGTAAELEKAGAHVVVHRLDEIELVY